MALSGLSLRAEVQRSKWGFEEAYDNAEVNPFLKDFRERLRSCLAHKLEYAPKFYDELTNGIQSMGDLHYPISFQWNCSLLLS